MKILNTKLGRQAIAAALVLSLAIPMSMGAFAEEPAAETPLTDDTVIAGYLPPQDESVMIQGDIALHSGDVAVGEVDPNYGGYASPVANPIQGDIMLISAPAETLPSDTLVEKSEARYTVKGFLGKQVLYTARQDGRVLTISLPEEDRLYQSKRELQERICTCLGGRVAEELILGDISTGASSDLQTATSIARSMVMKYGMSERIGAIAYDSGQEVFIGRSMAQSRSYSEEVAGLIDEEIKAILDAAYARCRGILTRCHEQLERTAQYLLEFETMSAEDFKLVFDDPAALEERKVHERAERERKAQQEAEQRRRDELAREAEQRERERAAREALEAQKARANGRKDPPEPPDDPDPF